jgi:hypothetical protein
VGRVRHPADLPEGYHTAPQGQSWTRPAGCCVEGCPRGAAWSGCARSTGCRTSPSVQDHRWARSSRRPGGHACHPARLSVTDDSSRGHVSARHVALAPSPRSLRSGVRRAPIVGPASPSPQGSGSRRSHLNRRPPTACRAPRVLDAPFTDRRCRPRCVAQRPTRVRRVHTFLSLIKAAPAAPRGAVSDAAASARAGRAACRPVPAQHAAATSPQAI